MAVRSQDVNSGKSHNDLVSYDPNKKTWSKMSFTCEGKTIEPRWCYLMNVDEAKSYRSYVYVIGGQDDNYKRIPRLLKIEI